MSHRFILFVAALSGAVAVILGAFGAHALHRVLENNGHLDTYETAVRYQFYHTLALLGVGMLKRSYAAATLRWSAYSFAGGMVLFSGSLYLLALLDVPKLGVVTPLGGLLLIAGWVLLAVTFLGKNKTPA